MHVTLHKIKVNQDIFKIRGMSYTGAMYPEEEAISERTNSNLKQFPHQLGFYILCLKRVNIILEHIERR